jgi:predicted dehydrogenase
VTHHFRSLIGKVDAVSIATPTTSHYEIARFFLKNGVHVFIEKPITTTLREANALIRIARRKNLIIQVGHIERFNPAFKYISPLIHKTRFIEAQRLTSFKLRGSDVSVILDLMIHDIDIVLSLTNARIRDIRATGASVLTPHIDIANARIEFDNGSVASITASRVNTSSERRLRVFQNDCYLNVDLNRHVCRLHRKKTDESTPSIETEEIHIDKGDALNEEISAFLNSISHHTSPPVSGKDGRDALAVAMKITKIINKNNAKYK